MSRILKTRLGKLEAAHQSQPAGRNHLILGQSNAELEQQEEAKRAAGEIQDGDRVMRVLFVEARNGKPASEDPEDPDREGSP